MKVEVGDYVKVRGNFNPYKVISIDEVDGVIVYHLQCKKEWQEDGKIKRLNWDYINANHLDIEKVIK